MDKVEDGGPAFPVVAEGGEGSGLHPDRWDGMTLRDYFAGQALAAVISVTSSGMHTPRGLYSEPRNPSMDIREAMARDAYDIADAMLLARKAGDQS